MVHSYNKTGDEEKKHHLTEISNSYQKNEFSYLCAKFWSHLYFEIRTQRQLITNIFCLFQTGKNSCTAWRIFIVIIQQNNWSILPLSFIFLLSMNLGWQNYICLWENRTYLTLYERSNWWATSNVFCLNEHKHFVWVWS